MGTHTGCGASGERERDEKDRRQTRSGGYINDHKGEISLTKARRVRKGMAFFLRLVEWPAAPPPIPPLPPPPPLPPSLPPSVPVASFTFDQNEEILWPRGWSSNSRFKWRRADSNLHDPSRRHTGPSGSPGLCRKDEGERAREGLTIRSCGIGYFLFAGGRGELDEFGGGTKGTTYTLSYDGSVCAAAGTIIQRIEFEYHMFAKPLEPGTSDFRQINMGTLKVRAADGAIAWARHGNQGDAWHHTEATVMSSAFDIAYVRGEGWGEPAVANFVVHCFQAQTAAAPPTPPRPYAPPLSPSPPLQWSRGSWQALHVFEPLHALFIWLDSVAAPLAYSDSVLQPLAVAFLDNDGPKLRLQVLAALVVLALLSWFAALWSCAWCYERYRKADAEKEGGSPSAIWHPRRAPAFFSKRRGAYEVL